MRTKGEDAVPDAAIHVLEGLGSLSVLSGFLGGVELRGLTGEVGVHGGNVWGDFFETHNPSNPHQGT